MTGLEQAELYELVALLDRPARLPACDHSLGRLARCLADILSTENMKIYFLERHTSCFHVMFGAIL